MRTTAVCVVLSLAALAGCGGQTETVTQTVSIGEDDATTETATIQQPELSAERAPVIYHDHINDLDFDWAWQRLSPELQTEFGPRCLGCWIREHVLLGSGERSTARSQ